VCVLKVERCTQKPRGFQLPSFQLFIPHWSASLFTADIYRDRPQQNRKVPSKREGLHELLRRFIFRIVMSLKILIYSRPYSATFFNCVDSRHRMMRNRTLRRIKRLLILRYFEELRKTTKEPTQDYCCPGWDSYSEPQEYETGALTIKLRHLISYYNDVHYLAVTNKLFSSPSSIRK
jgi:hypothetical protein